MTIKLRLFLFSLITGFIFNAHAQVNPTQNRGCGTDVLPQQFETWVQSITPPTPHRGYGQNQALSVFNIPVVVHVIHNNEPVNSNGATTGGNISAAQVMDQINILNKDFNGLNPDTSLIPAVFKPMLGKFQFNFCMAVVNPTGGIMPEPGIDRINRNALNFTAPPFAMNYITSTIKPATIWNPNLYMNMWVCGISGGILGFATFPNPGTSGLAGLTGSFGTATTDGLVMLNTAFGSIGTAATGGAYNKGRTATHEIGHWLGLRHIWGDGNCATDYCNDTPPAQNANYGCPTFPYKSGICAGNTTGEMTMNYMDYGDDICIYMFSNDQKNRAQLIMTNSPMRATLLTSTVCSLPSTTNDIGILFVTSPTYSQVMNCNSAINPVVNIHNFGSNIISSATFSYNVDGLNVQTFSWTGALLPGASATVALPQVSNMANGAHNYYVGVYQPNGIADPNPMNNNNSQLFSITNAFSLTASGAATLCSGGSAVLTAGGTATSFIWEPGTMSGTTVTVSPAATVVYTLTGSNGACSGTRTIQVTVNPFLSIGTSANPPSLCNAGSVTLSATGATSYTWDNGSTLSTYIVSPNITTTYSVTGSNGSCSGIATITIPVGTTPTVLINSTPGTAICSGGSATLTATGAPTYSWSNGATGSVIVVSPMSTSDYTLTGSDNLCSNTATVSVTVGSGSIALSISASPTVICAGGSSTITAGGATSYTWNTGSNATSIVVNPTITTVYSFDGFDSGCLGNASATIAVQPSSSLNIAVAPSGTLCLGKTATLTASGNYTSYVWTSPASTNSSIAVTPTTTVTYTVSGFGVSASCNTSSVVTINVVGNPLSMLTSTNASCLNPCTGIVNAITTGGTAPYTYSITGSTCTSVPCTNLCPGLYTIYTIDAYGCSSPKIFSIANSASSFQAAITTTNASCSACADGVLNANPSGGVGPYTYSWSPSGGTAITAMSLTASCYTVTVMDAAGCSAIDSACVGIGVGISIHANNSFALSVYPNPAKNSVTIACPETQFDYTVYNHLGQLIVLNKNSYGSATLDISAYASGIYLIEVNNGREKARKKLIIE